MQDGQPSACPWFKARGRGSSWRGVVPSVGVLKPYWARKLLASPVAKLARWANLGITRVRVRVRVRARMRALAVRGSPWPT